MADAVWDLRKTLNQSNEQDQRTRCDSDPGLTIAENKAADIAVPGGFRRNFLQTNQHQVSRPLREQIVNKISSVYDPFIGSVLSQDNDTYDELEQEERIQSLLQTPVLPHRLPIRLPIQLKDKATEEIATEKTKLLSSSKVQASHSPAGGKGEQTKTTTLWHALLTLLKSFVGTGILFLPDGFRSGGILFAPMLLTLVAALTLYAMLRLLQCRTLVGGTYGHIGEIAYGPWGRRMVQISIILMQAGFCCTYVIFVAQNMADVLEYMGLPIQVSTLILLQIFVYIPLSWIRYISYFSISNLVADFFILYGVTYIIANSIQLLSTQGPQEVVYFNEKDYPVFIGTAVFTFEGIGLVLPTQSSLNKRRQAKFPNLLIVTVTGLLFFYCFFAGINYLALGPAMMPMITSSLPRNNWSISVQFGYSIAQLLSYPLFLFPAVKIMEEMMGFPKRASGRKFAKNLFRAIAVIVTVGIAFFGQNRLDLFVSIVGAFCCVPLSFVYPPLFYLKLQPKSHFYEKVLDIFVVVFGILTFFYVTYSNLQKWSQ